MVQKDAEAKLDSFESEIDSAIDDLFNPSRQIEIDPVTSRVREVSVSKADKEESSEPLSEYTLELENEPAIKSEVQSPDIKDRLERCQQHLLTLEWEITDTNIGLARDSIEEFFEAIEPGERHSMGELPSLIYRVFDLMLSSPGSLPMNGLKAIQEALGAIKEVIGGGSMGSELVSASIAKLNELILLGSGQSAEEPTASVHAQVSSSAAFENPEEMESFELEIEEGPPVTAASDENAVRLSKEEIGAARVTTETASETLVYPKTETVGESSKSPLAPELYEAIDAHIDGLDRCITRMLRVEQLMASTKGMEKLFTFYKSIREDLEQGRKKICKVFPDLRHPVPCPVSDIAVKKTLVREKEDLAAPKQKYEEASGVCPWTKLFMTSWGGKTVALIPEEIAFEGRAGWRASKKMKDLRLVPLKILRPWPWTKIGARLKGELSRKDEAQLVSTEFPLINPPWLVPAASGKKAVTVILYAADKGAVMFADSEPLLFPVQKDWTWESGEDNGPYCLGIIKNDAGESIPVITVTAL